MAVGVAVVCMGGLTAKAVISSTACTNRPILVNVAASTDIDPAVAAVADQFNKQNATSAGRCVQVQVSPTDSAGEMAQIDGQTKASTGPVDAWIPDSSLWVDAAHMNTIGAQKVQPTGKSVARSPLMLVTTKAVAAKTGIFAVPASWNLLLPNAYGGPPASLNLSVDLPDPSSSAAGLSSLIEVSRMLSTNPAAVTNFALTVTRTESFNSVPALSQFVQSTQSLGRKSVTVASEQAVLAYDKKNPGAPLAAQYVTSPNKTLATPELDYPYVLTASNSVTTRAAAMFGRYLRTKYAQSLMRWYGFRSANGLPDVMPSSTGLPSQPLQLASAPSATEAASNLQVWQKLGLGSRDLVLLDVSPPMGNPSGFAGMTIEQLVTDTASKGLGFFPDNTQMGLWVMGKSPSINPPYDKLVPIGPLSADYGLILRRTQIQQVTKTITTSQSGTLAMRDTILDAYRMMTATYAKNYANAIIVLTTGVDTASGDISLNSLLTQLRKLYNPNRKVEIIVLLFGSPGNLQTMQEIAKATGGEAFLITDPSQIGQVFFEGVSLRMCGQGCIRP